MKKYLLRNSLILLSVLTGASCNKADERAVATMPQQATNKATGVPNKINAIKIRGADCSPTMRMDCVMMDEVVIRPHLFDAIRTAITNGKSAIGSLFADGAANEITSHIPDDWTTKLSSGNYNLSVAYESNGKAVLIAGTASSLTDENKEFAIEFSY